MPKRRLRDWLSVQVSTVTEAGHAHKGFRIGAQRCAEAGHFHQPTGNQRRTRIGAEADAIRHTCPDGNDVFTAPPSCTPIKSGLM